MLSSLQHPDLFGPKNDGHSDTSSNNSPITPNAHPKPFTAELAWPTTVNCSISDPIRPLLSMPATNYGYGWGSHHSSIWTDHPLVSPLPDLDTTFPTLDQNKPNLIDGRYPQRRKEDSALYAALPSIWATSDPGWEQQQQQQPQPQQHQNQNQYQNQQQQYQQQQQQQQQQRRFSVAEPRIDYWSSLAKEIRPFEEMSSGLVGRRHSVAGPYVTAQDHPMLTDDYIRQRQVLNKDLLEHIDEYFGPRTLPGINSPESATQSMGKGVLLQNFKDSSSLYRVEFKAGRTEMCYVMEGPQSPKVGDLVIVEADRGRDLGTVIADSLTPDEVLATLSETTEDDKFLHPKDVHVKRLYRIATPNEINTLSLKEQDEAKALAVCQTKLKQKNMAMEVVNAEYQWDRRKLTFYFVAEQRIDFRELVRELFKIYKTRIWMCAVKTTESNE